MEQKAKRVKTQKTVNTTKHMKILGHQEYVHRETGQIVNCEVVQYEDRDANFLKFWVIQVLTLIEEISDSKTKIIFYILDNINRNRSNVLTKTIAEIVKETGISKPTVIFTLKALERHDIIRRKTGVIFLNPNVIFRGGTNARRALLIEYLNLENNVVELPERKTQEE